MRGFAASVYSTCALIFFLGCGDVKTPPVAAPTPTPSPGIINARRDKESVVLTVVLRDQFKLQLYEADVAGPQYWLRTDPPADIAIQLKDGRLTMGVASEKMDTSGIKLETDFSPLAPNTMEIRIGTREKDGKSLPISIKLVPTTPSEKLAINKSQ